MMERTARKGNVPPRHVHHREALAPEYDFEFVLPKP